MSMPQVSIGPGERACKTVNLVLQRLQEPGTAAAAAVAMGVSESTVSRIKNERLQEVAQLLSCLGLKVVPNEFKCVDPEAYAFLTKTHEKIMRVAPQMIWEVDA